MVLINRHIPGLLVTVTEPAPALSYLLEGGGGGWGQEPLQCLAGVSFQLEDDFCLGDLKVIKMVTLPSTPQSSFFSFPSLITAGTSMFLGGMR